MGKHKGNGRKDTCEYLFIWFLLCINAQLKLPTQPPVWAHSSNSLLSHLYVSAQLKLPTRLLYVSEQLKLSTHAPVYKRTVKAPYSSSCV